jgi:hypothetical protein
MEAPLITQGTLTDSNTRNPHANANSIPLGGTIAFAGTPQSSIPDQPAVASLSPIDRRTLAVCYYLAHWWVVVW